ncbi:MerR family DNA-binding transcriptional regulator [Brunnivagina elsteri]|uniref:HTH merR-type domain-containing protein n=1 Tax=Brunnivagina elsteri CCALA 953 TaxID=987040 RepID=A0A2A2TEB6_9CYAN|nr:MerR family DNA-binding transcriptional regulator [Calothrix elsteri]PAX52082.1 hypothetical protein CK510_21240 [Calothrix elsteri CCALA 953]
MFKMGKVSRILGINSQTLYFYERIGLIPPPQRTEAGYRIFNQLDVDRLLKKATRLSLICVLRLKEISLMPQW